MSSPDRDLLRRWQRNADAEARATAALHGNATVAAIDGYVHEHGVQPPDL